MNYSDLDEIRSQQLSPYNMQYFQGLENEVNQINYEIKHIDHFQQERQKKFSRSMKEYKKYLENQRKGLQKNYQHCKLRNGWYKQQIKKSWQIGMSNRPLILRSLARTNILKRDCDQQLSRIDDYILSGQQANNFLQNRTQIINSKINESIGPEAELKGSKLLQKYNQILQEYHKKV